MGKKRLLIVDIEDLPQEQPIQQEHMPLPFVSSMEEVGLAHAQLQQYIVYMSNYYQLDFNEMDERIWKKADAVLRAKDPIEANTLIRAADRTLETFLLGTWSKGDIKGPRTTENFEKQAKGLESLAKMMFKKGEDEKAAELERRAKELRNTPAAK